MINGNKVFANHMNIKDMALKGYCVQSGCVVTGGGAGVMNVHITAGAVWRNGLQVAVAAQDVTIATADVSYPRKDILYIDSTGTGQITPGSPAAAIPATATGPNTTVPIPPNIPTDETTLCEVWVAAGVTGILAADITDISITMTYSLADFESRILAFEGIIFPDAALLASIRTALSIPRGPIYQSDLDLVSTYFTSNNGDIVSLEGMENWDVLIAFVCQVNLVADLSPLAGLTNLTGLLLDLNQIVDISPLAGLTNLTGLSLSLNQIVDISPLAALTSLAGLDISRNSIVDISAIVDTIQYAENGDLILSSNPLCVAAYHTDIPALQARSINVIFDGEPTPDAIAIDPATGPTTGGTAVSITGTGFLSGCTVTIDGVPCTSVVFIGSTHITAVTPAGTAGAKDVVVTNDVQFGTAAAAFTYV